jgi:TolA-binding protein
MTTDDNKDVSVTVTTEPIEGISETTTGTNVEPVKTAEDLVNEAIDKFNTKIDELLKAHKSETDTLKEEITKKNEEIEKLKTINRNIIMSTDVSKNKDSEIDFTTVDFDEVNWDKETNDYFKTIDSKVF